MGNNLSVFHNEWNQELLRQSEPVTPAVKHLLYLTQVSKHPLMAADMDHYHRQEDDSPEKTYEWLVKRVEAAISRKRKTMF